MTAIALNELNCTVFAQKIPKYIIKAGLARLLKDMRAHPSFFLILFIGAAIGETS
jgi:F0F1-type ATP synthase membrane subunit c/vacuolar-type H+-ATPase subunit K